MTFSETNIKRVLNVKTLPVLDQGNRYILLQLMARKGVPERAHEFLQPIIAKMYTTAAIVEMYVFPGVLNKSI